MAITTYAELQTAIGDWLNRADLDQKIPDFIRLAESTLNDVLRSADMVASNTAANIRPRYIALRRARSCVCSGCIHRG